MSKDEEIVHNKLIDPGIYLCSFTNEVIEIGLVKKNHGYSRLKKFNSCNKENCYCSCFYNEETISNNKPELYLTEILDG